MYLLFPYTTLFRSVVAFLAVVAAERAVVPWARNTVGA